MIISNWNQYIKEQKSIYRKIKAIECKALSNEKVYFNNYGLNHLIYKGRLPRPRTEVVTRFTLLSYVKNTLKIIKKIDSEEMRVDGQLSIYYWTIKHRVNDALSIRIVLRRLNNGNIHFYSVMRE